MKTLRSVLLLSIAILLSGCYTQLQYQQTAGEYASTSPDSEVEKERKDERRGSKVGYYYIDQHYMDQHRPYVAWYGGDYRDYYRSSWSGYGSYYSDWKWRNYMRYHHMPYRGSWFSFSFGFGNHYPYYDRWYDPYPYYSWGYGYGHGYSPWGNVYYNQYYFLDDDYAWYDDERGQDSRYGPRSIGTSRLGAGGDQRGDGRGIGSRSGFGSADASSSSVRTRGGNGDATRSTGSVGRTRSGGSSSGSTGSGSTTRKRGGNDDIQRDRDGDMQRSRDNADGVIRYRSLPETSRSTDVANFPTVDLDHRSGEVNRLQRVRTLYGSGNDFSWNTQTLQDRLKGYRVESVERPVTRERKGFLQRLGEFFESSRDSYDHIWDNRGDYGNDRGRDRGSTGSRGSVGRDSGSSGSDGRSRSSGGSRSRGSGGGDDDGGSSRSRGGGN